MYEKNWEDFFAKLTAAREAVAALEKVLPYPLRQREQELMSRIGIAGSQLAFAAEDAKTASKKNPWAGERRRCPYPYCNADILVNNDGRLRKHDYEVKGRACPGSEFNFSNPEMGEREKMAKRAATIFGWEN